MKIETNQVDSILSFEEINMIKYICFKINLPLATAIGQSTEMRKTQNKITKTPTFMISDYQKQNRS